MAVFVRNAVCLLSPPSFGATTATVLDKLAAPGVRIGMSPPKIDPLGDYTVRLFGLLEQLASRQRCGAAIARRGAGLAARRAAAEVRRQ